MDLVNAGVLLLSFELLIQYCEGEDEAFDMTQLFILMGEPLKQRAPIVVVRDKPSTIVC